eukprot:TRINITY_DN3380_c0_g1_i1.p1 TRINITY_DN3380_c0_g1~~TRINITY_DN3380_c0_g1_i1.p1  ORF type:complete len:183 (+),score=36.12 TRINITY_DN3380_c0_g1_i1:35-583(+)
MSSKLFLTIGNRALVCQDSILTGEITVGEGCIIHPKATILAEAGPIVIGRNNIIEEQVVIRNSYPEDATDEEKKVKKTMTIGDNNIFEVGCKVESDRIGQSNIVESKAKLSRGSSLANGCVVVACYQLPPIKLDENTVIWGTEGKTRVVPNAIENHLATHTKHLDILWNTIPKFHHLRKSEP